MPVPACLLGHYSLQIALLTGCGDAVSGVELLHEVRDAIDEALGLYSVLVSAAHPQDDASAAAQAHLDHFT